MPVPGVSATVVPVLPPVRAVADNVNPPIVPYVAFIAPAWVTLYSADAGVSFPAQNA